MTSKEKAESLVDKFRLILMDEDTDCGNEVLCTIIAIRCAKVAVEEVKEVFDMWDDDEGPLYWWWESVIHELNNM
jgi:hypothetical protein